MRSRKFLAALVALSTAVAFSGTTAVAAPVGAGAHQAKAKSKAKGKAKKRKHKKKKAAATPSLTVTGGTVTITPSAATSADFVQQKVSTTVTAPAQLAGEAVTLQIVSGKLNPASGHGSLTLSGGYAYTETSSLSLGELGSFTSGTEAAFAELGITLGVSSQLTATVGNPPTHAQFFALKGIKPVKSGTSLTIAGVQANLTAPAAQLLNDFGGSAFKTNGNFGTITISALV